MRRLSLVAVVLMSLVVVIVGSNVVQVWIAGKTNDTSRVDAIVVMGAAQYDGRPTAQFSARLDHALA